MGKVFFVDWALWQKMTFVLACLIVLTVLAGLLKLWYTHRKLRQYEKAGPQPINREKSIIRSLSLRKGPKKQKQKQKPAKEVMVQKRRPMDDRPSVPFGIRAIESGIEVDGVWISRNNTPAGSIREPSSSSLTAYKSITQQSRQGSLTDVGMTLTNDGTETSPFSTHIASSSREPSQTLSMDRSTSGGSIGSNPPSSPEPVASVSRRYPPHSYQRYEGSSSKHFRNAHTLETRVPTGMPTDPARIVSHHSSSSGSSRGGSNGSNELPYLDFARPPPIHQTGSPAFDDALQTHRMSQVAETGRLVPRSRRAGASGDWTSSPLATCDVHNFSLPRSQTPPPPSSSSSNNTLNPFTTPVSEKHPDVDFPEPKMPASEPKSRRGSSVSYTRPDPTVLRTVNSGFAVLKPGTLEAEAAAKESAHGVASQHARGRSASFDSNEKRQSRKLQKKRRPSDSSQSSFDAASDLERGGIKYSFDQHPPSDQEIEHGSQIEASGSKYKF
ncbi:hypothetical protein AUEXF2481DRAFT_25152 [Aureobasidium subglaciale EXF-2481]|uniref:Uncharacterized protein n=1 Tax=Aureobasidium subglaciale (strain EXF-2481) TaxID=1043005 RepID=A0A074Z3J1_AURSE|nr:uncharacterized protein AUEXF2481DRAFT_25152 [Aureobasidium subglaciale EXF-2481]KAI5200175.1 hypothetical protein E4T38_06657 [Aureobasidium subglaciale]KAI5218033.1 hypothetical protein E4T40_07073 [Aureobasidium subglaciale]KAI5221653.1 hypothetical protein E4T41_06993 [Aureobasidium subglaciale]KAI5259080.1 hypothetical protein E4T46_06971 [Aureobasidium subglaciale]KER00873.1 hypothetical protein AUEXF2481DRAFT_25152 [Aureobasidium subglaciale EXF-2481]